MIDLVYILGSTETRRVKIGHSTNVPVRAAAIQRMSPVSLVVLETFEGGLGLESALHKRFRPFRTHGEWFDFGDLDPLVEIAAGVEVYRTAKLLAAEKARHKAATKPHAVGVMLSRAMHPQARNIATAIAAIGIITDPVERVCDASRALRIIHNANHTLAAARRAAVEELRDQGWSHQRIGDAIGTHRSRVGQILSGEHTGVGVPGRKSKKADPGNAED